MQCILIKKFRYIKHQDENVCLINKRVGSWRKRNHPCQKSAGEGRPHHQPAPVNYYLFCLGDRWWRRAQQTSTSPPVTSLIHSCLPPEDQLGPKDIYSSVWQTNNYNIFSGIRTPVTFHTAHMPRGRYQLILNKLLHHKPIEQKFLTVLW